MQVKLTLVFLWFCIGFSCNNTEISPVFDDFSALQTPPKDEVKIPTDTITYLALGDSYTIGQGVNPAERWTVQLIQKLDSMGFRVKTPEIIAQTGWTTGDLKRAIENENPQKSYQMVSLLIGVNNQFQGGFLSNYAADFEELLQTAIRLADAQTKRVVVLSIPDYSVTPFGQGFIDTAEEIAKFNAVNQAIAQKYGVAYYNITPISQKAASDLSLLAEDKLHPSGKMYGLWATHILDGVARQLSE